MFFLVFRQNQQSSLLLEWKISFPSFFLTLLIDSSYINNTSKKIKQDKYYWLHSSKGVVPRFYGLPKIHKTDVPLRPIVSFINSPTYNLSKFLANIISALVTNRFSVNNSIDFIERIKNIAIEEDEILVSFDVVSLFTSVPVDHAIDIVVNLLDCDDSLSSRTQLSSQDIKKTFYIVQLSALLWVLAFLLF